MRQKADYTLSPDDSRTRLERLSPRLQNALTRQLTAGKPRRLGLAETLLLKRAGAADGRNGMPRETAPDQWTSSLISKEISAYEEFCSRVWGEQQVKLHWAHARCDSLVDDILDLTAKISEARAALPPEEPPALSRRKRGEEELSEAQVEARRGREATKRAAQSRAGLVRLTQTRDERLAELSLLHGFITESGNAARLVCQRVRDHTRQRLNVYWRAALRVHPDNGRMPAAIDPLGSSDAERTYLAKFERRNATVAELLQTYRDKLSGAGISASPAAEEVA